jgi:hypothetical protein
MKYRIESDIILIELNRSEIMDIAPGDQLESESLGASYTWADQDMQFLESNPDARIFLKFEKKGDACTGKGVVILPQEVY